MSYLIHQGKYGKVIFYHPTDTHEIILVDCGSKSLGWTATWNNGGIVAYNLIPKSVGGCLGLYRKDDNVEFYCDPAPEDLLREFTV